MSGHDVRNLPSLGVNQADANVGKVVSARRAASASIALMKPGAQRGKGFGRLDRKHARLGSQLDGLRTANEQRDARLLFKTAHVVTHRRRRRIQFRSRPGETAQPRRRLERANG